MNRRFAKTKFPYDALAYRGIKRFAQDVQPHASKCQCTACQQYLKVIARLEQEYVATLAPALRDTFQSRILTDDDGLTYVRNAQVRTPEDIAASKSKLKWNDKNRPYQIANGNRSSASWRGGVFTQVRTAPAYTVLDDGTVKVNVPAPAPAPANGILRNVPKRDNRTAREKRYAARMQRFNARNAKQIVSSSNTRIMPMVTHRRNGQVILSNNRIEETGTRTSVVQHTSMPKNASLENASTLVARKY